jgi:hypothetical protein
MSFEKLIENYAIVENSEVIFDYDEEINLDEYILEMEQKINPNLQSINWTMFDYVYVNAAIGIRSSVDESYNIDDNYAVLLVATTHASFILSHALDFIDNNRNGGKQVMSNVYSSSFLQALANKSGSTIRYYSFSPESNPTGDCFMAITLFKKPINAMDVFPVGNYTVDINSSANFSYELTPSVPMWNGYNIVNVLFSINDVQYTSMARKSGKDFTGGKEFTPPVVDINGTEIVNVYISYSYDDRAMPQGINIAVYGNNTGDGKAYINGLTFVVDGYV